jgi:hypothetical protein
LQQKLVSNTISLQSQRWLCFAQLRIIYIQCECKSESLFIDVFIGVQESKKKVLENGGFLLKVERRIKAKKF